LQNLETVRGRRRRVTETIARRRRAEYISWMSDGVPTDLLDWAKDLGRWAKRGSLACPCSKRKPGAPRRGLGICGMCRRDRIYRMRAQSRELDRLVRRGNDPEGDAVYRLSERRIPKNFD